MYNPDTCKLIFTHAEVYTRAVMCSVSQYFHHEMIRISSELSPAGYLYLEPRTTLTRDELHLAVKDYHLYARLSNSLGYKLSDEFIVKHGCMDVIEATFKNKLVLNKISCEHAPVVTPNVVFDFHQGHTLISGSNPCIIPNFSGISDRGDVDRDNDEIMVDVDSDNDAFRTRYPLFPRRGSIARTSDIASTLFKIACRYGDIDKIKYFESMLKEPLTHDFIVNLSLKNIIRSDSVDAFNYLLGDIVNQLIKGTPAPLNTIPTTSMSMTNTSLTDIITIACISGSVNIVKHILPGYKIASIFTVEMINMMQHALMSKNMDLVKYLIEYYAKITYEDTRNILKTNSMHDEIGQVIAGDRYMKIGQFCAGCLLHTMEVGLTTYKKYAVICGEFGYTPAFDAFIPACMRDKSTKIVRYMLEDCDTSNYQAACTQNIKTTQELMRNYNAAELGIDNYQVLMSELHIDTPYIVIGLLTACTFMNTGVIKLLHGRTIAAGYDLLPYQEIINECFKVKCKRGDRAYMKKLIDLGAYDCDCGTALEDHGKGGYRCQ